MTDVLILGASGKLGRRVAGRLLEQGLGVRAASRHPERLGSLRERGATPVLRDLRDPASSARAVDGVDVVFHAAHALAPPDRRNPSAAVDGAGVEALLHEAERLGVAQVVLSSVIGASPDHPSPFVRHKAAAEEQLQASEIASTILRMAAFMETHVLELLGDPIRHDRRPQVVGPGTAPRNFVSVDDAAAVAARAVADPAASGTTVLEVAGPQNLSDLETVGLLAAALGRSVAPRHLPLPAARVVRGVTRFVHPPLSTLLALAIATAEHGEAVDLTPRPGLVVGTTTLDEVVERWAAGVRAEGTGDHRSPALS